MPKISVLMSVYKEPLEWVAEAIDSILNQTFTDFEYIIVNDNPESAELKAFLDNYAKKDARIKIFTNEQNIGLTKSLNTGLAQCTGEYIARMDADDISLPQRFAKQVSFMDSHPDVGIVGSWTQFIGSKRGFAKYPIDNNRLKALLLFSSPFDHPATLFRSDIINKFKIKYDENLRFAQDQKFWFELSKVCDFANIPDVLFVHRYNEQQISKVHSKAQIDIMHKVRGIMIFDFLKAKNIAFDLDDIKISTIKQLKTRLTIICPDEELKVTNIIMSLLHSLPVYNLKTLFAFIFSNIYKTKGWSSKDFLRIILKHIHPSLFSWAGINTQQIKNNS